ncbi:hypothetical protein [Chitinophaga rhizophila]|uniref:Lipoprotein n=1 Tax=Chitinophaga rhizophila TaxID=2866212 RepID=A0ABS7GJH5_9BACT|nr:hypothetical protein [Chitinophaga rhizophila]MBW8687866.1 hypothetical protein [Chitinophaga rhizophila]
MKKLLILGMCGCMLTPFIACNSGQSTDQRGDSTAEAMPVEGTDTIAGSADEGGYSQQLTYKQYSFSVNSKGEGALRKLTITGRDSASDFDEVNMPLEGDIYYASTADLNGDGKPEVYAFTRGKDSAGYSKVYAYAFDKQTGKQISFPDLTPEQSKEYMGHDSIYIDKNYLVRSFSTDKGDAVPQRKTIRYVLRPGENGFQAIKEQ